MKKSLLILSIVMFIASGSAFAGGMVFDPTEYPTIDPIPVIKTNSTSSTVKSTTPSSEISTIKTEKTTNTIKPETTKSLSDDVLPTNKTIEQNIKNSANLSQDAISGQTGNFSNALLELDSAQVNIRNELLEYQAKYQEVDTQYQLIKEQRKVLAEQIKSIKKRINSIEKSKQDIRKTMI